MYKRIFGVLSGIALIAASLAPLPVAFAADSSTPRQNAEGENCVTGLVHTGLWAGVDLSLAPARSTCPDAPESYLNDDTQTNQTSTDTATTTDTTDTPTTTSQTSSTDTTRTPQPASTQGAYVALGDSVAAGIGLAGDVQEPRGQTNCDRTTSAYPYIVAERIGQPLVHLACSGDEFEDLIPGQNLLGFGGRSQIELAFANGTPATLTITAGANDIGWVNILRTCYLSDCATRNTTERVNSRLEDLQGSVISGLEAIDARSGGTPPTVVVTGYYNPVSPACTTVTTNVTAQEIRWITAGVEALNKTLRDVVALYPNARFAPVNFTGHDVCSGQSWIQGQGTPAPFHPTAEGQRAIAGAVAGALGR